MKKFDFRLADALRLRESQLQIERTKLQLLLSEQQRLERSAEDLVSERRTASELIRQHADFEAVDLRSLSSFFLGADVRAETLRKQKERQTKLIQEQKKRALLADRNVRLLVKLRDKKLAAWVYESDREIEALAQEAWLSRYLSERNG